MKHINLLTMILGCMLMISACSEKTVAVKKDAELKQTTLGDKFPSEIATSVYDKAPITTKNVPEMEDLEEDCHGKRAVSQTLEGVEGTMLKVGDKYVISTNNGNSRYNPCDLSKKFLTEGMLIRFSGEVLEIRPGERLIATPFRLKNIVERDR